MNLLFKENFSGENFTTFGHISANFGAIFLPVLYSVLKYRRVAILG
jgi:hypothetical protein